MKHKDYQEVKSHLFCFYGTAMRGRLKGLEVYGRGYQYIEGYGFYIFVDAYIDKDGHYQELPRPSWRKVEATNIICGFEETIDETLESEASWTNK